VKTTQTLDDRFGAFLASIEDLSGFVRPDDEWPVIVIFDRPTAPPLPLQFARPDTPEQIIGLGALIAATAKGEQAATVLLLVPATTDDGEEVIVASAHTDLDAKIRIARVHRSESDSPTIGSWLSPREFDDLGDWYVAQYFRLVVAL
jgi:hypothetical protein